MTAPAAPAPPYVLWITARGNGDRYIALLRLHGYLIELGRPCARCGETFAHVHTSDGSLVPTDAFGLPLR